MAIKNCGIHVYDSDQYDECPYCLSGRKVMNFNLLDGKPRTDINTGMQGGRQAQSAAREDRYVTVPVDRTVSANALRMSAASGVINSFHVNEERIDPEVKYGNEPKPNGDQAQAGQKPVQNESQSLNSEEGFLKPDNRPISSENDFTDIEKGVFSYNSAEAEQPKSASPVDRALTAQENKTVGIFHKTFSREPVVGWLVCVEGEQKGRDFRILGGMNSLGRSERMDICLRGDNTVSKENHARIAYDPKHNGCRLIPSEKSTNIYINDNPVYTSEKLTNMDRVDIGESRFIYISFCDDIYSWDK